MSGLEWGEIDLGEWPVEQLVPMAEGISDKFWLAAGMDPAPEHNLTVEFTPSEARLIGKATIVLAMLIRMKTAVGGDDE